MYVGRQAIVVVSTIYTSASAAPLSQKWFYKATQVAASIISMADKLTMLLASLCEATSGFTNLMDSKCKL